MSESGSAPVCIVDDDPAVRDSLSTFLQSAGLDTRTFDSAESFLKNYHPEVCACLLLDIRLPEKTGLDLQEDLLTVGSFLPVIFITGHGDVPTAVQALKAGAFDFLQKPFDHDILLDRINKAMEQAATRRAVLARRSAIQKRLQHLTPRETEVLEHLVMGKSSKEIARELDLSPRTIDIHRAHIMQKMQTHSVAELVRMVDQLPATSGWGAGSKESGHEPLHS